MEAIAEQLVATYLTRGGKVFIIPQYPIPSDNPDQDWACPDFVALNFERVPHEIIVVEVSMASNVSGMFDRVIDRHHQWFVRLRKKLEMDGITNADWDIRFLRFIREENFKVVPHHLTSSPDVYFQTIESVSFPWNYWEARKGGGLPR